MKSLLLLILSIISLQIFAQETHNFKIESGKLVYEKVIQESKTLSELKNSISKIPGEIITEDSTKLIYQIKNHEIPYRSYGGTDMGTAFFAQNPFSGTISIETKADRFRIKAENLIFENVSLGVIYPGTNTVTTFEKVILRKKNSEFRTEKSLTKGLSYYDRFFTEIFQATAGSDEW